MEYYFDRDDKLDRERYAKFLETLLLHCDDYRREDSDGAYVIALDSPWGTGKTRFVKMLRNYLEDRTSEAEKSRPVGTKSVPIPPGKNAKFSVVYYNAWETDFSTDALEPLFYSLLKSPELAPDQFDASGQEILNEFEKATKEMLKAAGYALAHHFLGEAAASIIKAGVDAANEKEQNPYEDYVKRFEKISNFKNALTAMIEVIKQKKLVIIIDELDRCRPTFAIETLEIAKHLFAVPNLIFIFVLDIKQLSCSIETVYGQGINASGYLSRFFDYITRIPSPDRKAFIKAILVKSDPKLSIESSISCDNDDQKSSDLFISFVNELAILNSLSYRDITTIFASFRIMLSSWLGKYKYLPAYELYFVFLLIKYKYSIDFSRILSVNGVEKIPEFVSSTAHLPTNSIIEKQLAFLALKTPICKTSISAYLLGAPGETILEKNGVYPQLQDQATDTKITYRRCQIPMHILDNLVWDIVSSNSEIAFDHFLYIDDFRNWERIKNLTPAQYLERQLEMFDFVLPADTKPEQS